MSSSADGASINSEFVLIHNDVLKTIILLETPLFPNKQYHTSMLSEPYWCIKRMHVNIQLMKIWNMEQFEITLEKKPKTKKRKVLKDFWKCIFL